MKFVFLHGESGKLYAINPDAVMSVHDCNDPDKNSKTEIWTSTGTYYSQENMGEVVAAMERNGK